MLREKTKDQILCECEGVHTFRKGGTEDDCPYEKGSGTGRRQWWFNGFFSAITHAKFPRFVNLPELLALVAFFVIVGCGLPSSDESANHKPVPKNETVWSVVGEYIDAGRIVDSDKLILIVDRLRETDAITDLDRSKFYAAFPGIKEKRRGVTSEDAGVLRGLK